MASRREGKERVMTERKKIRVGESGEEPIDVGGRGLLKLSEPGLF